MPGQLENHCAQLGKDDDTRQHEVVKLRRRALGREALSVGRACREHAGEAIVQPARLMTPHLLGQLREDAVAHLQRGVEGQSGDVEGQARKPLKRMP